MALPRTPAVTVVPMAPAASAWVPTEHESKLSMPPSPPPPPLELLLLPLLLPEPPPLEVLLPPPLPEVLPELLPLEVEPPPLLLYLLPPGVPPPPLLELLHAAPNPSAAAPARTPTKPTPIKCLTMRHLSPRSRRRNFFQPCAIVAERTGLGRATQWKTSGSPVAPRRQRRRAREHHLE